MGGDRENLLGTFSSVFWPNLVREGVRLPGGALHKARCIEVFTDFVGPNSRIPQAATLPFTVYVRNLYLRVRKDWTGLTMWLESVVRQSTQPEENEDPSPHPQPQAVDELVEPVPQQDDQSPSLVVLSILDELAPREEFGESESGADGEPAEA